MLVQIHFTAEGPAGQMRHKSYQTTQKYINMARLMDAAVEALHVPAVLRADAQ
jgi:hypothetical protein